MKTLHCLIARTYKTFMTMAAVLLMAGVNPAFSQEAETVFDGNKSDHSFIWGIDLETSVIQHEPSTQFGMRAGILFNHSILVGVTGALNVTHPTVNYGYAGPMIQYTYKPNSLLHLNGLVSFGSGSTKDYESEKSGTFDNFGNVTGARFYFIEPGINGEVNLNAKTRLVLGFGYRLVYGIDRNSEYLSRTHVSDSDLSDVNISLGIRFGLY